MNNVEVLPDIMLSAGEKTMVVWATGERLWEVNQGN